MSVLMVVAALGMQPLPVQDGTTSTNATVSAAMAEAISNRSRARTAPSFINEPEYVRPEAARSAGEFGEVVLSGIVGEDGRLHEARIAVSSRSPAIDAVALASVPAILFEPARDDDGGPLSIPASLSLEYSHVGFHGPRGLASYRCAQFVRDYDWWYRTRAADKQDRVFRTLRGYAAVADLRSGQLGGDFASEW